MDKYVTISQLAKLFEVSHHTIRHYEDKGLIKPAFIDNNGYRKYDMEEAYDLAFVLLFRKLGLSLSEISILKETGEKEKAVQFFEEKIKEVDSQIDELQEIKRRLNRQVSLLKRDYSEKNIFIEQPIYLEKVTELKHEDSLTLKELLVAKNPACFFSSTIIYHVKKTTYAVFLEVDQPTEHFIPQGKYEVKWLLANTEQELNQQLEKVGTHIDSSFYVFEEMSHLVGSNDKLTWKVLIQND